MCAVADNSRHLTLANGLHLKLRHAPHLKRAAAALRVHAGSHDAPARWPGLAHFLEHLFFLGTERFPLEDGLMRHVQALGGQVNASTRERTTDFFFEVPPNALAGGLQRLCQMLAEPELGIARQRSERDVIHAEFIAWSRDPQAQARFALLQAAAPGHPLSGFHAGNRYTLAVQDVAFQQALQHFHQHFYQGGQITLSLCGPQPLHELERLGQRFASLFPTGHHQPQHRPPALPASTKALLFAHDSLPAGGEQALELLLAWLNDSRPGGWLDALRQRGWLQGCKTEVLYAHEDQLLWHIDLRLDSTACLDEAQRLFHGWFHFMHRAAAEQLNAGFALLQQRREEAASALELARRDSAGTPFCALDRPGLRAFGALLDGLPKHAYGQWQLQTTDPLLFNGWPATPAGSLPKALSVSDALPASRLHAELNLRWQIRSPLRQRLHAVLEQALAPLHERAERASLQLDFSTVGDYWHLRCAGVPSAVVRVSEEALEVLRKPTDESFTRVPAKPSPLIPIRTLLKQLPDALHAMAVEPLPACTLDQGKLQQIWQHAAWHGLATGFDETGLNALATVLQRCPGQGSDARPLPPTLTRRWQQAAATGSEHALLLFYPLTSREQGSGRLLGHLLQGPVYQRLRVELQLGYAVFSTFRQVEGVPGLLFGVQSPHAGHRDIIGHLQAVLRQGVRLQAGARQALAEQFSEAAMTNADVAHWAWQAHLGRLPDKLTCLRQSILMTQQADLDALLGHMLAPDATWLCLANTAEPSLWWP
nr:pyrroloquinoline quinone biosynthesis protein PqqF [Pseudomonas sp. HD6421]